MQRAQNSKRRVFKLPVHGLVHLAALLAGVKEACVTWQA